MSEFEVNSFGNSGKIPPQHKLPNDYVGETQKGSTFIPKYKKNIVYKDFNNDGVVRENEAYMVDMKPKNSIFNGKVVDYQETWIDEDGDGLSDKLIRTYKDKNTGEIINREIFNQKDADKNSPLYNTPQYMKNLVEESDRDWYQSPFE